ncbi:MAG: alkaline phosphatase family protein, partial [Gemmatimonadota bacterium]|nr:alkaline phosphatase family protein [Gemmatimonadota bacterium]
RTSVESLIGTLKKHGIPDVQTVYFPGVDLYTHVSDTALPGQRDYLRTVIDSAVGQVLQAYRDAGALGSTYVLFIADHGHTPVLDDDRHALQAEGDGEPTSLITQTGFRIREMDLDVSEEEDDDDADEEAQDYQAVVAYQGAMAYLYLADRSTCPAVRSRCDWNRAPRWQEDVVPMLQAFDLANRTGVGVPELEGTLDLIFSRPPRPPGQDALPFQVWDRGRLVPVAEYLTRHPRPDLLDLAARLEGLGAGPYGHRAGDILLLAKSGLERPIEDRFYFSNKFRSWHGSPTAQDSRIPLIVAREGASGDDIRKRVTGAVGGRPTQLSITPLVRALLDSEPR